MYQRREFSGIPGTGDPEGKNAVAGLALTGSGQLAAADLVLQILDPSGAAVPGAIMDIHGSGHGPQAASVAADGPGRLTAAVQFPVRIQVRAPGFRYDRNSVFGGIAATEFGAPHVILANFPSEQGYAATLGENVDAVLAAAGTL